MKYKPIGNYHMEKTLTLVRLVHFSCFHPLHNKKNTLCGTYTQHNEFSCISKKNKMFKMFYAGVGFLTSHYDIKSNQLNCS